MRRTAPFLVQVFVVFYVLAMSAAGIGEPENYTLPEMAQLLRKSVDALKCMRSRGQAPPAIKVGRSVLFPRAAYLRWVEARLDQPTKPVLRSVR